MRDNTLLFRISTNGIGVTNVESGNADGTWEDSPGFFFIATLLEEASKVIYQRINDDIERMEDE